MEDKLRALIDWCVKLTLTSAKHTEADVEHLRSHGWTDEEISATCFVASYSNFINRVADGLGVDIPQWMSEQEHLPPCPWVP